MKTYLGVNTKTNRCCIIESDGIMAKMSATNWMGNDDISRTCNMKNFVLTGVKEKYDGRYSGTDYDMGHEYDFNFCFDEIWEVKKVIDKIQKI